MPPPIQRSELDDVLAQLEEHVGDREVSSEGQTVRLSAVDALLGELAGDLDASGQKAGKRPSAPSDVEGEPNRPRDRSPVHSAQPASLVPGGPLTPSDHAELEAEDAFFASLAVEQLDDTLDGPATAEAPVLSAPKAPDVGPATSRPPPLPPSALKGGQSNDLNLAGKGIPTVVPEAPPEPSEERDALPLTATGSWRVSHEAVAQPPGQDEESSRGDATDVFITEGSGGMDAQALAEASADDAFEDDLELLLDEDVLIISDVPDAPPADDAPARSEPPLDDRAQDLIDSLFIDDD